MSTIGSELSHDEKKPRHKAIKARSEGRTKAGRKLLFLTIAIVALVLWQLHPVITGLQTAQNTLKAAEPTRTMLGEVISLTYIKVKGFVVPLLTRIFH